MTNFWKILNKPIFALAPMEDVTDTVFRKIVVECGKPDVMFTEFTNTEGLQSVGQSHVIHRLKYSEVERPLVAQIWGITPQNYYDSARLIVKMGFDGLDINFGCPVKKVIKAGACSALIKNPDLAKEIIQATKEGLGGNIPLSIKTRIGFNRISTEEWIGFLLEVGQPAALTIHGRTVKEMSKVPVHWNEIGKAIDLRNQLSPETLILGNGDLFDRQTAREKIEQYQLDGVMIARGIFHNPWFFDPAVDPKKKSPQERLDLLEKHVRLFEQTWGVNKDYHILKRFYKIYLHQFEGAAHLRQKFMETTNYNEVDELIRSL